MLTLIKLDVKNTDELIVTAMINFLSWNLQGAGKKRNLKPALILLFFEEWNQLHRPRCLKTVLVCKMYKNDNYIETLQNNRTD